MKRLACLAALLAALVPAAAQVATPSTEQMIEQLKPAPRTRSLRNLIVEPGQDPAAATAPAPRPSLSLLIQFGFDSTQVQPESQEALANLARALLSPELADSRFAVEGHTDAKGRAEYNLRLSQRRADAVRDVLASHGVPAARLVTSGRGATELAEPADPYAAANRRVRIVNLD